MSLKIGHASIDENNQIQGGKAGDQTGREVCTRAYYRHSKGWYLLRPKSVDVANAIAEAMTEACNNNNVGYDQNNRTGVIVKLRSYKTLGRIGVKTECDCSSLVRACCIQAGFDPGNFTTADEAVTLEKSGYFESKISVTTDTVLHNGDVLVTKTKGHTVIVVSGNPREAVNTSVKIDTVKEVQAWLNSNYNAGLSVDNDYGPKTKEALIKALQTELNNSYGAKLAVDGDFGTRTKKAIVSLKKGSSGNYVKVLQALLVCKGYTTAYVDGDYGDGTRKAVLSFQRNNRLTDDGIAGKNTFFKLCL